MVTEHRESYPKNADFRIDAVRLRDQITSPARTVLLVLLAASALIFVIACSNVANLILARSVRREGELAIRAALGASAGALRRTLLAESLLLCGAGAALGVLIARPMVAVLARYAARFSVRALDLTVDASLLWVGVGLALVAAVLLAFVPRLPSADASNGFGLSNGSVRITSGTNRRLRVFAVTQIAASFVLLAGAGALLTTLFALQSASTGINTHNVLALHVPVNYERPREQTLPLYKEAIRRISELPGVERVAVGTLVPWREAGAFFAAQFTVEGYAKADGEEDPRGRFRTVSPGFFAALGVPIIAGRDFNAADHQRQRKGRHRQPEPGAAAVSQSGRGQPPPALDRSRHEVHRRQHRPAPDRRRRRRRRRREHRSRRRRWSCITRWIRRSAAAGCSCTRAPIRTRWCRRSRGSFADLSADQPVEQAATLDDVRAEVLAPNRLNAMVFGGFAGVALTIAVVGVAGVLAFSVSARTREFGVRLAIGSDAAPSARADSRRGRRDRRAPALPRALSAESRSRGSSACSSRTSPCPASCRSPAPPRF